MSRLSGGPYNASLPYLSSAPLTSRSDTSRGAGTATTEELHALLLATATRPNCREQDESLVLLHPDYPSEVQRGSLRALTYARRRLPLLLDLALGRTEIVEEHRQALWRAQGARRECTDAEETSSPVRPQAASTAGSSNNQEGTSTVEKGRNRDTNDLRPTAKDENIGHRRNLPQEQRAATSLTPSPRLPPPLSRAETIGLSHITTRLLCGKTASSREGSADAQTSATGPVWDVATARYFFRYHRDEVSRVCTALSDACERLERVVPTAMAAPFPNEQSSETVVGGVSTADDGHTGAEKAKWENETASSADQRLDTNKESTTVAGNHNGTLEDWIPLPVRWVRQPPQPSTTPSDTVLAPSTQIEKDRCGDVAASGGPAADRPAEEQGEDQHMTAQHPPVPSTHSPSSHSEERGWQCRTRRVPLSELSGYLEEQCRIIHNALLLLESLLVAVVMENSFFTLRIGQSVSPLTGPGSGLPLEVDPFAGNALAAAAGTPPPHAVSSFSSGSATSPSLVGENEFMRRSDVVAHHRTTLKESAALQKDPMPLSAPPPSHATDTTTTSASTRDVNKRNNDGREKHTGKEIAEEEEEEEEEQDAITFVVERATQSFMKLFLSITTIENQLSRYSHLHEHHHGLCVAATETAEAKPKEGAADEEDTTTAASGVRSTAHISDADKASFLATAALTHGPSKHCAVCQRFYKVEEEVSVHVDANMRILKLASIALVAHDTDIAEAAINFMDSQDVVFTAQATMLLAHVLTPELLAAHPTESRGGKALKWMLGFVFGGWDSADVARTQKRRQLLRADSNPFSIADSTASSRTRSGSSGSGRFAKDGDGFEGSGGDDGAGEKPHRSLHSASLLDLVDGDGILGEDESDFSFASSGSSSGSGGGAGGAGGPDFAANDPMADTYNGIGLRVEYILGACFTRCHPLMTVVGTIAESNAYDCGAVVAKAVLQYAVTLSHTSARLLRTPLLTTRWSTPFTEAMMRGLNELAKLTQSESVLLGSPASSCSSGWASTTTTDSEKEEEEEGLKEKTSSSFPAAAPATSGGQGLSEVLTASVTNTTEASATSPFRGYAEEGSLRLQHPPPPPPPRLSHEQHSRHGVHVRDKHRERVARRSSRRNRMTAQDDETFQRAVQTLSAYLKSRSDSSANELSGDAQAFTLPPIMRLPPLTRVYMEKRRHRFRPRPRGEVTGTTAADRAESPRNRSFRRSIALQWAKCVILSARTLIKSGITKVPVPREHYETLYHQSKRLQGMLDEWFERERRLRGGEAPPQDSAPGHLESANPFSVLESKASSAMGNLQALAAADAEDGVGGDGDDDDDGRGTSRSTSPTSQKLAGKTSSSPSHTDRASPVSSPAAQRRNASVTGRNAELQSPSSDAQQPQPAPQQDPSDIPPNTTSRSVMEAKYQEAFAASFCLGKDALDLFTESPYVNVPVHEVLFASFFTILDAVSDVVLCEEPRVNTIFINELVTLLYEVRLSMLEARTHVELITPQATRFRSLSERDAVMHDQNLSPFEILFPAEYGVLMEKAFRCEEVIERWRVELDKNPNHPAAGFASLLHHLHRKLQRYEHPTDQELLISRATLRLLLGVTARDEAGDIHGDVLHVDDLDVEGTKKEEIAPRLGVTASMDAMRGSREDLQLLIHRQNIDVGVYRTPSHSRRNSAAATPIPSDDEEGDKRDEKEHRTHRGRHHHHRLAESRSGSSSSCSTCSSDASDASADAPSRLSGRRSRGRRHGSGSRSSNEAGSGRCSPSEGEEGRAEDGGASAAGHAATTTTQWLTRINESETSFYTDSLSASPLQCPEKENRSFEQATQLQEEANLPEKPKEEREGRRGSHQGSDSGAIDPPFADGAAAAASRQKPASPPHLDARDVSAPAGARGHSRLSSQDTADEGDQQHHHHHHHHQQRFSANHMAQRRSHVEPEQRPHSIKVIGNAEDMFVMAQRAPASWGIPSAAEILCRADRQELAKEPALANAIARVHTEAKRDDAVSGCGSPLLLSNATASLTASTHRPPISPVLNNASIEAKRFVAAGGGRSSREGTPVTAAAPGPLPSARGDDTLYILQVLLPRAPTLEKAAASTAADANTDASQGRATSGVTLVRQKGSVPVESGSAGENATKGEHNTTTSTTTSTASPTNETVHVTTETTNTQGKANATTSSSSDQKYEGVSETTPSTAAAVDGVVTSGGGEEAVDEDTGTEWNLRRFDPNRPPNWAPPSGTLPAVKRRHCLSLSVLSGRPNQGQAQPPPHPAHESSTRLSSTPTGVDPSLPWALQSAASDRHHSAGVAQCGKNLSAQETGSENVLRRREDGSGAMETTPEDASRSSSVPGKRKKGRKQKHHEVRNQSFDLSRMPNARRLLETMDASSSNFTTPGNKSFSFFVTNKPFLASSSSSSSSSSSGDDDASEGEEEEEEGNGSASDNGEDGDVVFPTPLSDEGPLEAEDGDEDHCARRWRLQQQAFNAHHHYHHRRRGAGGGRCDDPLSASAPLLSSHLPNERTHPKASATTTTTVLDDAGERVPVSTRTTSAAASIVRDCERAQGRGQVRESLFRYSPATASGKAREDGSVGNSNSNNSRDQRPVLASTEGAGGTNDSARLTSPASSAAMRDGAVTDAASPEPARFDEAEPQTPSELFPPSDAPVTRSDGAASPTVPKRLRGETFFYRPSLSSGLMDSTDDLTVAAMHRQQSAMEEEKAAAAAAAAAQYSRAPAAAVGALLLASPSPATRSNASPASTGSQEAAADPSVTLTTASTSGAAAAAASPVMVSATATNSFVNLSLSPPFLPGYSSTGSTPPTIAGPSMLRSCLSSSRAFGGIAGAAATALRAPFGHRPPSPGHATFPSLAASLGSTGSPISPVPHAHAASSLAPVLLAPITPPPPPLPASPQGHAAHTTEPDASVVPLTTAHLQAQEKQQQQQQRKATETLLSLPVPPSVLHHNPKMKSGAVAAGVSADQPNEQPQPASAPHSPKRVQFAELPAQPAHHTNFNHTVSNNNSTGSSRAGTNHLAFPSSSATQQKTTSHASSENLSDLST